MDNDYELDLDAVLETVRAGDVLSFRFVTISERLLIDNRFSALDSPMMKVVQRAASAKERFKSLKVLRPRFRLPEKITAIWWPRYVDALVESGVWEALIRRMEVNGFTNAAAEMQPVLDELRCLERAELHRAIAGEGYQTLWAVAR
ncbi:MAG TPA: hypothetical protein VFY79_10105 [Dehalococcoidia bacterium]|nr:hypothetical protein [Dehalococcoidia bacterium]